MRERTINRLRQILGALDALGMHTESARHRRVVGERKPRSDDLAVRLLLVVHLDLPRPVVGDDDEHRRPVADRGVDFHRVEPERPVAGHHHDGPIGAREARRYAEGRADADATEWTGVEPSRHCQADPGEAEDITAVGHDHRVVSDPILQTGEQAIRMHAPVAGAHSRSIAGARPPATSTIPSSAAAQLANSSTSPRRLSRNSDATSAMRTKRASPKTAGDP